jgi:hypothetical protein
MRRDGARFWKIDTDLKLDVVQRAIAAIPARCFTRVVAPFGGGEAQHAGHLRRTIRQFVVGRDQ